jgi:hypothetical protein
VFANLFKVHTTKKSMYSIGGLEGNKRGYIKWQQVRMPLRRTDQINEVLSLFSFSPYTYFDET